MIGQPTLAEVEAEATEREAAARREREAAEQADAARMAAEQLATQQKVEREAALAEAHAFWGAVDLADILTENGCEKMVGEVGRLAARDTWLALSEYASSKERDAAIRALEKCRAAEEKEHRKIVVGVVRDFRKDYGVALEDAYDEANPHNRGDLVSTVSGSRLTVTMSGGFAGRARHTEAELNDWCADDGSMFFSKITLISKAHGTFTCVPVGWPGSEDSLIDSFADETLGGPWGVAAGVKPVPPEPEYGQESVAE